MALGVLRHGGSGQIAPSVAISQQQLRRTVGAVHIFDHEYVSTVWPDWRFCLVQRPNPRLR
jgi:hypothetical protein